MTMPNFYLVWAEETGRTNYRHSLIESARAEAERLARENPTRKFYVLEAKGFAEVPAPPAIYHELDDLPF